MTQDTHSNNSIQDLEQCLEKARYLLKSAQNNDWADVEQHITAYQRQLQHLKTVEFTDSEAEQAYKITQEMKDLDAALTTLAKDQQEALFTQLKKGNQGRKMQAAYGKR